MSPPPHARRAAMRVSDATDGASIRATRVMPTVPDASAMVAARVATGIVGASTAIGIATATATAVAVTGRPQSAVASARPSALLIAMEPSAKGSNATVTVTATPPRRLSKIQPAK